MDKNNRSLLLEVSVVSGLALIGFASGTGPLLPVAVMLGGIGGNWASSLVEKSYSRWCDTWFTERGAMNHDISWALGEAFKQAVRQLKLDWQETPHYHQLRRQSRAAAENSLEPFDWLVADAQELFGNAARLAAVAEATEARELLSQGQPAMMLHLQNALGDYLHGQPCAELVQSKLADEWQFRFREILKDPDEHGTRAMRAYELLWQTSVDAALAELRHETALGARLTGEVKQDTGQILASVSAIETLLKRSLEQPFAAPPEPSFLASPPPPTSPIPTPDDFTGLQQELQEYRNQLTQQRLAVITGMAGVGKQTLGSQLAAEFASDGSVFWMTFRQGVDVDAASMLRALAGYLYHQGESRLWQVLQVEEQAGEQQQMDVKIRSLLAGLAEGRHLLCFQNLHLAGDDPAVDSLLAELRHKSGNNVYLMVLSLDIPDFASDAATKPLTGLTPSDARLLLTRQGVSELSSAVFDELMRATQGNAQLLRLFARSVVTAGESEASGEVDGERARNVVNRLAQSPDVRAFLLHEVYDALDPDEQRLAELLSAFRLPIDDQQIEILSILDAEGIADSRPLIDELVGKSVVVRLGDTGQIDFHPVIRQYLYSRLSGQRGLARRLHLAIAEYYQATQDDIIEAAYHYQMAEAPERCVELLYERGEHLISSGRSTQVLALLKPYGTHHGSPSMRATLAGLQGQAQLFVGNLDEALGYFEVAVESYEEIDMGPVERRRAANIARQVGRIYGMREDFDRAHAFMRHGLAWLAGPATRADKEVAALLHTHTGSLYVWQDRYDDAEQSCQQALALLGSLLERAGHAEVFMVLGVICDVTGRWTEAVAYARRSMEIWRRLGNNYRGARAADNLATLYFCRGDFDEAEMLYRRNLEIWQEVGATIEIAIAFSNLAGVCLIRGEYQQTRSYCDRALLIFQKSDQPGQTSMVYNNLGALELALGNFERAEEQFQLSRELDPSAENLRGLAEAALGLNQPNQALQYVRESLELAEQTGMPFEQAVSLRSLGRVTDSLDEPENARQLLVRSVGLFRDLGARYELARSLYALAPVEHRAGREEDARGHLAEATALFGDVGAMADLQRATDLTAI